MVPLLAFLSIAGQTNAVPGSLLAKLDRGVNVTRWFCYLGGPGTPAQFKTYFKPADFAQLKRLDVHYVRLCLAPEVVDEANAPKKETMPYLDEALAKLQGNSLAVLLDLHDNGQLKLDTTGDRDGFVAWWRAMAARYRGKGYGSLAFELLNEPVFEKNPEDWAVLQEKAVAAIRAVDPKRTIVVTSTKWSGIDEFVKMKPLAAKNLVYTFHCYDPFWFTHQGATWAGEAPKSIKGLEFPANAANVERVAAAMPKPYDDWIRDYGRQKPDAAFLLGRLKLAADWGRANRVPVLMGEFGSYPPVAPPESRARWFAAMRAAIATTRVSNCLWGYDDGFGLGRSVGADGTVHVDPVTVKNLYGK